jgi:predicted Zn-dependent protease
MKQFFLLLTMAVTFSACHKNAVTGRKQLKFFGEESLRQMALTQYRSFLSQNQVLSETVNKDAEMVRRVGNRIAKAINDYYTQTGQQDVLQELQGYSWEFNLINNKEVNAWCMPGGKVVVYTGLLPIAQNEAALAVVMGHEITHAIAQGLEIVGNIATANNPKYNNLFNGVFAPGAQVGFLLPNSRKQEYESDKLGLRFAAMAGYNPREAIPFWQRMSQAGGGQKPPEFLSTHPSDENRIAKLQEYMDEALKFYKPVAPSGK